MNASAKWLILALVAVAVLAGAVLLPRKSAHAELVFEQAPEEVWAALMDTSVQSDWNPIFESVEGAYRVGATMQYGMVTADGSIAPVESRVVEMVPNKLLNQLGGYPGILTFDHQWILEATPEGTRVVQHEEYRGIGVLFVDVSYVPSLYQQGLVALRSRLDGTVPTSLASGDAPSD